jgi:predicted transcriptional regulator
MTLDAYLTEHDMKDSEFALQVRCDRSTIYRIRRGQRPSPDLMVRIAEATGGLVQPNDFYLQAGLAA